MGLGFAPVVDLEQIARGRVAFWKRGIEMPLQDAEREAGLTEADIWMFNKRANAG